MGVQSNILVVNEENQFTAVFITENKISTVIHTILKYIYEYIPYIVLSKYVLYLLQNLKKILYQMKYLLTINGD